MHNENQHTDPLERLFQKKAREFDIPFREEDWQKLEKQLDITDLRMAYRRKIRALVAAAILIICFLGYFTFENHNRLNQLASQLEALPTEQTENNLPEYLVLEEAEPGEGAASEGKNRYEPVEERPVIAEELPVESEPEEFFHAEKEAQRDNLTEFLFTDRPVIESFPLAAMHSEIIPLLTEENIQAILNNKPRFEPVGGELAVVYEGATGTYASDDFFNTEPATLHASRFAVGMAISPDMSTVGGISGFENPGYKFGVSAEYRLTRNLSLKAGVLASSVRYSAQGMQYNPPNYWNTGVIPDETSAVCLLLDIPLGIKYNVIHFQGSRFFATAGLSSYIMLNEEYRFSYNNGNGQYNLEQGVSVRNGSRHLFNNAGFSVGYELDIYPNWSLRAEPFINIPLSGVGWGDVDLYSIGSFVSLNFQL